MRHFPKIEETYPPAVVAQVQIALQEIGTIQPWLDEETGAWMFEHPNYPESYGGESPEEVVQGYPLYLANLFQSQMEGRLAPSVEKKIKGRGGFRPGAGRPRKYPTRQIRVPEDVLDIIQWLREDPSRAEAVRRLMQA